MQVVSRMENLTDITWNEPFRSVIKIFKNLVTFWVRFKSANLETVTNHSVFLSQQGNFETLVMKFRPPKVTKNL